MSVISDQFADAPSIIEKVEMKDLTAARTPGHFIDDAVIEELSEEEEEEDEEYYDEFEEQGLERALELGMDEINDQDWDSIAGGMEFLPHSILFSKF